MRNTAIKPKELRDAYNRPVPPRLHEVFAGRWQLLLIERELERLRDKLTGHEDRPETEATDFANVLRHLDAASELLCRGLPGVACDCSADEECPWCGERRWLTMAEYFAKQHHEQPLSLLGCSSSSPR